MAFRAWAGRPPRPGPGHGGPPASWAGLAGYCVGAGAGWVLARPGVARAVALDIRSTGAVARGADARPGSCGVVVAIWHDGRL